MNILDDTNPIQSNKKVDEPLVQLNSGTKKKIYKKVLSKKFLANQAACQNILASLFAKKKIEIKMKIDREADQPKRVEEDNELIGSIDAMFAKKQQPLAKVQAKEGGTQSDSRLIQNDVK